jgi:hypothetical protein
MKRISLLILLSVFIFNGCKKKSDEPNITIPVVSTSAISSITTSKASGGGSVSNDGNSAITGSGLCWSKSNTTPTLSDNKAEAAITNSSFSIELTGLESNTTYYVRAYATNAIGTAYGQVISFSTVANLGPVASTPAISGNSKTNAVLTLTYVYSDPDNDPEGVTTFQWYRANTSAGAGESAIPGATEKTYVVQESDLGKYIRAGVAPKATLGLTTGSEVKSAFTGVIGVGNDVTFIYNGRYVTYGVITSQTTERKWMDRNLGAPNKPTHVMDIENYGDLFQWGRAADGHQVTAWPLANGGTGKDVNGMTSAVAPYAYSNTDDPGTSKFIFVLMNDPDEGAMDWRKPQNNNLWQLPDNKNNPCPKGWHVPTADEFNAERFITIFDAFDKMNFTSSGTRSPAGFYLTGSLNSSPYWTSTIADENTQRVRSYAFTFNMYVNSLTPTIRSAGIPVRCIKN